MPECHYCLDNNLFDGEILVQTDTAYMVRPLGSEHNTLIIPKSHVESPLELSPTWWASLAELLAKVPDLSESYNISLNYGKPAGQTQPHLHFWVVGRADGEPASGIGLAKLVRLYNEVQSDSAARSNS